mmetsp:Transcript_34590/g.81059  ORF Transcript_34590/g.81059 Transcript_34590/m.81059 type:complete len:270 (+) Transcript_34590:1192-2001(+)
MPVLIHQRTGGVGDAADAAGVRLSGADAPKLCKRPCPSVLCRAPVLLVATFVGARDSTLHEPRHVAAHLVLTVVAPTEGCAVGSDSAAVKPPRGDVAEPTVVVIAVAHFTVWAVRGAPIPRGVVGEDEGHVELPVCVHAKALQHAGRICGVQVVEFARGEPVLTRVKVSPDRARVESPASYSVVVECDQGVLIHQKIRIVGVQGERHVDIPHLLFDTLLILIHNDGRILPCPLHSRKDGGQRTECQHTRRPPLSSPAPRLEPLPCCTCP